jgi:hypothetical protein
MAIELHPKDALIMAALATKRPIAFLVGSPLSQKDGAGVPGVKQMLDFARDEIRERIPFALPSFEAALPKTSDAEDYQAAMRWLGIRAGQDAINDVIARAVLQARKQATGDLTIGTDGQPDDWNIPPGTTALAELVARGGEKFAGPILTTNFDPLLSLAVRNSGGRAGRRVLTADGTLAGAAEDDPGICNVVHLHGFWRDSDTLHTQAQLTNPRPKLKASLQRLLVARQRTLIVAAYGGWDDVFTQSLVELMNDEQAKLDVIWCFHENDPLKVEERFGKLLKAVSPAIVLNRFRPFGGIDCHSIFTEILSTLRGMSSPAVVASTVLSPLAAWEQVDAAYLDALPALDQTDVIRYFDGAVPTWQHAVSQAIPRRRPLKEIAERLARFQRGKDGCSMQLIRAAGGEGKTTLLLQAASDAVRHGNWTVLWRPSPHGRLLAEHLLELDVSKQWLVVADDAETLVTDLKEAAFQLHGAGRSNVHFLLAARDVDWRVQLGDTQEWETWLNAWVGRPRAITLRGIHPDDALLVVEAWANFGSDGLRELANLAGTAQQVNALVSRVQDAAHKQVVQERSRLPVEGSFFGGLLAVRFGQRGLKAHVRAFLGRLKGDPIKDSSHSLFDALLYVAACHAVGIPGLDERVLADLVGVSRDWVQTLIVGPLGEEAAAVRNAGCVLTRHGIVAAEILIAAEEDLGADIAEVWSALVRQTVRTGRDFHFDETFAQIVHAGPRLQRALPGHFSEQRRKEIAIAAAKASIAAQPDRLSEVVGLGRTYRSANDFAAAISTFRQNLNDLASKNDFDSNVRGYWNEWAVAEGRGNAEREHALANTWLAGLALSDHLSNASVTDDNAKMICAGLGVSLGALDEPTFHRARRAAAYLGRITERGPKGLSYFDKHDLDADKLGTPYPKSIEEAIDWLTLGVAEAGRELRDPFLIALLKPEHVSFNMLRRTLTRPSRLRVDTLPTSAKTTPTVDTRLQQPLSDFEARVKAGIERVLKEAWEAIPSDMGEEERYKVARRNAARAISRLSPHIKRQVSAYFETQKWRPLEAYAKKL